MSHLDLTGCKKRKRGEKVFKFRTFGEHGCPIESRGPFWQNLKALLEFGHSESGGGMASWSFQLKVHRHPPVHVFLFVVEEQIEASINRHCKHCQFVGWGQHMICNKKYHFLVPSKDTISACLSFWDNHDGSDSTKGKYNFVELKGHVMHGVFHCNGFGHLLCVNGVEMGSDLTGHQIMDFWDRLCTGLRAREVSLYDNSQKRSMDLSLIHGVAYGMPWFGRWGYSFHRGSFGVTPTMYQKAVEAIKSMPLSLLVHHLVSFNHEISIIFSRYQTLSAHSLVTLGDLLHFMLEIKSRLPKESCVDSYKPGLLVETSCRWSPKRVEMATRVIVEALKRAEFRWVSRQEVRDAARAYIGDTGLLDFVLKSLGNHIVGNYLVRRSLNPVTKVLEYCLEDISKAIPNQEGIVMKDSKVKTQYNITRLQLVRDMFHLYKHVLKDQKPTMTAGILATIPIASRIILDSKYLIKDYPEDLPPKLLGLETKSKLYCTVMLSNNGHEVDERLGNIIMAPYECIMLRHNATFDELKLEVERSFREIYWGLRCLVVQSIANLKAKGSDLVFGLVEEGGKLVFKGTNGERRIITEDIYEGTNSNCVMDCPCGAKDNDGERMISCDICEVWQHSRCARIPDDEEIPNIFLCSRCEQDISLFHSLP
ncbi:PHD finger protein MALE STERILITY 1 [Cornus florida]|uniref:PHD finger protein MALE STERILITY 1 n=1 Tax=Cornus florida TaxID=4283 RepID=UPI0028A25D7A|nr:PHD finger protein MALE STERILITY 1 [Cornus florida]